MAAKSKRATIYFDPLLHKALKIKAAETAQSVSELVNEAVRNALAEDAEDLCALQPGGEESLQAFEDVLQELKQHGRI